MRVSKTHITRQKGLLYYLGADGRVWATPMRGHSGSKRRVGTEVITRDKSKMYWVDGDGFVCAKSR